MLKALQDKLIDLINPEKPLDVVGFIDLINQCYTCTVEASEIADVVCDKAQILLLNQQEDDKGVTGLLRDRFSRLEELLIKSALHKL